MLTRLFLLISILIFKFELKLCQVCVETKLEWREVSETYLYTYMEAYKKSNCLFWCTDTRVATAIGTRNVQKKVPEQINVCCDGYVTDEKNIANGIHCKPSCSPECKNGYCKAPGECACNQGYIVDVTDPHNCLPLCIDGCNHGTCVAPNTCECDSGYESINGKCEPVCTESCHNGACIAPDTCHCLPGYQKTENNTCELHCSSYTDNGECIYTFACDPGWTKINTGDIEVCEPICTNQCVNGYCVAPDTCECFHGYKYSTKEKCEPFCMSGCPHGKCVGPETCVCDPGWYRKGTDDVCLAHCDHACGNGTCIAPDVCECYLGYKLRDNIDLEDMTLPLCVPVCRDCEGSCIAPARCVCKPPLETRHLTADDIPCDCYDNCSDWTRQCVKTICVNTITDTTAIHNEFENADIATESSLTNNFEYAGSIENNYSHNYEQEIEKASWFDSKWIYGTVAVLIIGFLILTIGAIMKKKIKFISKNILFYRDATNKDASPVSVHYKQNSAI